jgi:beta-lactamase class D
MAKINCFFLLVFAILFACGSKKLVITTQNHDWKHHYDSFGVKGCFVLLDEENKQYHYFDSAMANTGFIPASTFKIFSSMVGLETGKIADQNFVIPWNGHQYSNALWNADHDLKTAYQHSCVWYYQELARRVGRDTMKLWLDKLQYGNRDTAGGDVWFWLNGSLRISPQEQIAFLKRLYHNDLPLSARTMNITKSIMLQDSTSSYEMRAKTGWSEQDGKSIGWYVGWVESQGKVYYFANMFQTAEDISPQRIAARKTIVYHILKELKII